MRRITRTAIQTALLGTMFMGFAMPASALNIIAGTTTATATGNQTSTNDINTIVEGLCSCTESYKQNVGGGESGALAGSYNTTFANSPTDPAEFTITYTGGITAGVITYLLVKDGNQTPAWYLYQLNGTGGLGWTGTDTIFGSNFWPDQGAVSHVSLYGPTGTGPGPGPGPGGGPVVPEPASLLLLGSGLGAAAWRVRRRRQATA